MALNDPPELVVIDVGVLAVEDTPALSDEHGDGLVGDTFYVEGIIDRAGDVLARAQHVANLALNGFVARGVQGHDWSPWGVGWVVPGGGSTPPPGGSVRWRSRGRSRGGRRWRRGGQRRWGHRPARRPRGR
nr:MAG TPA: hypothetical protein [Bacteriophage sp.]